MDFFRLFVIRTDQPARDPASFQLQHHLIHAKPLQNELNALLQNLTQRGG